MSLPKTAKTAHFREFPINSDIALFITTILLIQGIAHIQQISSSIVCMIFVSSLNMSVNDKSRADNSFSS